MKVINEVGKPIDDFIRNIKNMKIMEDVLILKNELNELNNDIVKLRKEVDMNENLKDFYRKCELLLLSSGLEDDYFLGELTDSGFNIIKKDSHDDFSVVKLKHQQDIKLLEDIKKPNSKNYFLYSYRLRLLYEKGGVARNEIRDEFFRKFDPEALIKVGTSRLTEHMNKIMREFWEDKLGYSLKDDCQPFQHEKRCHDRYYQLKLKSENGKLF